MSPEPCEDPPHTLDYVSSSAPTGRLPVASTIPGCEVIRELGRGGMGVVYQAFHRKRRQMVAVKTLQGSDPAALYRLKQEFRTLAEAAHANLVNYYELTAGDQQWFLMMELVEGVDFLQHVRDGDDNVRRETSLDHSVVDVRSDPPQRESKPATPDRSPSTLVNPDAASDPWLRLRQAMRQLVAGVAAIHRLGKLHRDLKPSNVLVAHDGRVVILDFGLAAELDWGGQHQSEENQIVGTLAYMSPEQAAGQPVTAASDWYSVGVMLFEALTGKQPFPGNGMQVLLDKQSREAPAPRELLAEVPHDLDELCVALLQRSPAARLQSGGEVLRRLGAAPSPATSLPEPPPASALLIGRQQHLAALHEAFLASRQGRPVVVLTHGRSGMGKSMLVQHFLDAVADQNGVVVLTGKCYERESVPYKALDSLVDALSRHLRSLRDLEAEALLPREIHLLSSVFPVLRSVRAVAAAPGRAAEIVDPLESRRRAFAALRELFGRLGDRRPLVLFIDDLQWGDAESATALTELLRGPDPPPLLLVGGYRSEDLDSSDCLRPLLAAWEKVMPSGDLRSLPVEPLTADEAGQLAAALLDSDDPAEQLRVETVARESGGSPFFVHALVQCLQAEGDPAQRDSTAETLTLDSVLWDRIRALPDDARRLLEVIAVSGQPLAQADACAASALETEHPTALSWLRSGRMIRGAGPVEREQVETYHDRVRETILARLPQSAVKDHHRRLAVTLEAPVLAAQASAGSDAPDLAKLAAGRLFDLAYHFDAAGEGQRALPYALAAAEQARARHALQIAVQQYRIAERGSATSDQATRYRVAAGLGQVLMLQGRYEDAERQFQAARRLAPTALTQAQTEGKLGEVAFKRGDLPACAAAVERALRLLGQRVPRWDATFTLFALWEVAVQTLHTWFPRWFLARRSLANAEKDLTICRLYSRLGYAYWFTRGPMPCFWTHLHELNLAECYEPSRELAQAYSEHAPAMSMIGWFERGIAYAEKSLAIRRAQGDVWGEGQTLHFYAVILLAASRWNECIEKSLAASQLLEQTGDHWELNSARYQIAHSLYRLGDLEGARREAWRFHEAALELGDTQGPAMSLDAWTLASCGRVPAEIIATELAVSTDDAQRAAQVLLAEAVRLLASDQPAEAADMLAKAVERIRKAGLSNAFVSPVFAWHATALRRKAEVPDCDPRQRTALLRQAAAAARQSLRVARRFQNDLPHALRECALLAASAARARQLFQESLDVAAKQGARYEHAQTLAARGGLGRQLGWPDWEADVKAAQQALAEMGIAS